MIERFCPFSRKTLFRDRVGATWQNARCTRVQKESHTWVNEELCKYLLNVRAGAEWNQVSDFDPKPTPVTVRKTDIILYLSKSSSSYFCVMCLQCFCSSSRLLFTINILFYTCTFKLENYATQDSLAPVPSGLSTGCFYTAPHLPDMRKCASIWKIHCNSYVVWFCTTYKISCTI